jgi:signal-transduction protein with cAMP-binding, CBS, and nucleotidyltransferase domain
VQSMCIQTYFIDSNANFQQVYPCKTDRQEIRMNVIQKMIFATGMSIVSGVTMHYMFSDLNRLPAFEDLDHEYVELLTPLFERFSCQAGSIVLQQGAPAEYLYLILNGQVEMLFKPHDGIPITITHLEKGDWFGWSAVVGSRKYTSSAIAILDLETIRIHGNELRKLCVEQPEAGKVVLERLADNVSVRWKDAHKQVQSILAKGMKNREY